MNTTLSASLFLQDDSTVRLEEKEALARHLAGLSRVRGYLQIKTWCGVMGITPNARGLRIAYAIAHSLQNAGMGTFFGPDDSGRPACFLFGGWLPQGEVQRFGESVLTQLGSSPQSLAA